MGYVYAIGNTKTKRIYIGRSGTVKGSRPESHFKALRGGRHTIEDLQKDYDRYGEESFFVKYLGDYDGGELCRMEIFMMKILRTQDRRYGYNYKDRSGTSPNAIKDKWRTPPSTWSPCHRVYAIKEKRA